MGLLFLHRKRTRLWTTGYFASGDLQPGFLRTQASANDRSWCLNCVGACGTMRWNVQAGLLCYPARYVHDEHHMPSSWMLAQPGVQGSPCELLSTLPVEISDQLKKRTKTFTADTNICRHRPTCLHAYVQVAIRICPSSSGFVPLIYALDPQDFMHVQVHTFAMKAKGKA